MCKNESASNIQRKCRIKPNTLCDLCEYSCPYVYCQHVECLTCEERYVCPMCEGDCTKCEDKKFCMNK